MHADPHSSVQPMGFLLLVRSAQDHVRLRVADLDMAESTQGGQLLHRVHSLQLHLVLQANQASLHVLPPGHLSVELPRDGPESFLRSLHPAEVVTVLELDVSIHRRHFQGAIVALLELVRLLVIADLRPCPKVGQAACAAQVQALLLQVLHILFELRNTGFGLVAHGHGAGSSTRLPCSALAGGDTLPLGHLLLVECRAAVAFVLQGVQLLKGRLHNIAELCGGRHRDLLGILDFLGSLTRLLLVILLLGIDGRDALGDRIQRRLALLHHARLRLLHQAPLLGQLLVKLGILLIRAGVCGPGCWRRRTGGGDPDLILLVLLAALSALRLLLRRFPKLPRHLLRSVVIRLELGLHLKRLLLAHLSQDCESLLRVGLVDHAHGAAHNEAGRACLELVVLLEDLLPVFGRIVVDLALQCRIVLRLLEVTHPHVGELILSAVEVPVLIEERLVAECHGH
mmetsp:Transcript_124424/g.265165  ORF Transcript_124424/g.265165 Transcript_124424/m.265165 type:complete len:455 (-) Transcript_124424:546-1910(-)